MLSDVDKKNAIWNTSSFVVSSLMNFLNYSIIFKTFDLNIFGFFILLSSIFGLGGSLDFGFGISTIKNLAEARKTNKNEFLHAYFNTFFLAFIMLGLIIVSILTIFCFTILKNSELVTNENVAGLNFNLIIMLMISTFIFNYINGYLKSIMEGFSEYIKLNQITILSVSVNTVLFIIILIFSLNIYYLAFFTLIVSIVSFSLNFIYIFIFKHFVVFNPRLFDFKLIKKYSLYGLNIQLSSFVGSFVDVIIKYLIGLNLSLNFVSYFESSKKIINFSNGLIFSTQRGLYVKLSEENILGRLKEYVNDKLYYFSRMSNYYSILFYGILNPGICLFILFWFKSYESLIIYLIFSISYSLINFAGCLYVVLMIEGKGLKLLIIQSVNVILTYGFLMLSIEMLKNALGLMGYYAATLISILIIFYSLVKSQELDYKNYLKRINIQDLIKLNLLVIIQLSLVIIFKEYMNYILILFQFIFILVFLKELRFFIKLAYDKISTLLADLKLKGLK